MWEVAHINVDGHKMTLILDEDKNETVENFDIGYGEVSSKSMLKDA